MRPPGSVNVLPATSVDQVPTPTNLRGTTQEMLDLVPRVVIAPSTQGIQSHVQKEGMWIGFDTKI